MLKFKNLSIQKKYEVLNQVEFILLDYGFLQICKDPNYKKKISVW